MPISERTFAELSAALGAAAAEISGTDPADLRTLLGALEDLADAIHAEL